MAEPVVRVELTASFLDVLAAIESLLTEPDAASAYEICLANSAPQSSPISGAFPESDGAIWTSRRSLPKHSRSSLHCPRGYRLREYLHGDYLILYTVATPGHLVHLLSIRHHRELSFQFSRLWAGPVVSPER